MTSPQTFRSDPEMFDKLYRGEPTFEGAPPQTGVPWDINQAQPRLMELEALGDPAGCPLAPILLSDGNVNGVLAPMGAVPEDNIRDTLTSNGWRIDLLGPTTYLVI